MLQRVRHGDLLELRPGLPAERPATGGQDHPAHFTLSARTQSLVDGGVLGVDGDDLAAAAATHLRDDWTTGDQALLVGEREPLAMLERGERRRKAGEADDGVEDDVGFGQRCELREGVGVVEAAAGPLGGNTELGCLLGEQLRVAPGGEGHDPVAVAVGCDDV